MKLILNDKRWSYQHKIC